MRVVVIGATGNVGTSVVRALSSDPDVTEIVAVARRAPQQPLGRASFVAADIRSAELEPILRGADAVIHLAWLIQPGRDEATTRSVNVDGSRRVFEAVAQAGVPRLVYASSIGAYSPGPKDRAVDESWPTGGTPSSFYSRHKVETERMLDDLEREHPQLQIVRLRPGLIFQPSAATEIRRLFVGPLLPGSLLRASLAPIVPDLPRLRLQAVHSDDVGEAYRLAARSELSGAINIASEPVIDPSTLGEMLGARPVPVPARVLRAGAALSYRLRLQPTEPGWLDMGLAVPIMSTERARRELGWTPRVAATDALRELVDGMRDAADAPTPPLARETSGPARLREFLTGVGRRQ